MEKAKTMDNNPYGYVSESSVKPAETSKPTSNESSETLVASTTATNDDASTLAERKEPLSTVERIKMEREYEKANPKEPLKPAEGIWKSKWMVVPAAILYGFGGG